jgi:polyhydroxybutyrate depolymerase
MKKPIAIVLALISLPLLVLLLEASRFHVTHRNTGTIVSSGRERGYVLHVPERYDRSRPAPLVISLHGAGLWGRAQQDISRWNAVADREGFLVVYPSAAHDLGPSVWEHDPGDEPTDVIFIADLIDALQKTYNIDASRIYANGLSNGGGMSFALSCTLSDRIAAFGLVAAAHLTPWSWCTDRKPVPMISFHGTADSATPLKGGPSWVAPRPFSDIKEWTSNWARRNRCHATPVESVVAADVVRLEYRGCADDAAVILYTLIGGGHTWPGGGDMPDWALGRVNRNIDASSEMWEFFQRHPLRK